MMEARYNGLRIREATAEEAEHGRWAWKDDFSGWVAERPECGTFFILKGTARNTPYGTYRMNATRRVLIHAGYSQYDKIILDEDGIAISEALDVEDRF